jgi:hypothetical protein
MDSGAGVWCNNTVTRKLSVSLCCVFCAPLQAIAMQWLLVMLAGWMGAKLAINKGNGFIRVFFFGVVVGTFVSPTIFLQIKPCF